MKWKFSLHDRWGRIVKYLYVRFSQDVNDRTLADRIAQAYLDKNYPGGYVDYDEVEEVFDQIDIEDVK
jgi:hypothetical protein